MFYNKEPKRLEPNALASDAGVEPTIRLEVENARYCTSLAISLSS
jgi:hypothetical protein